MLKRIALTIAGLSLAVGVGIPLAGRSDVAAATSAFNTSAAGPIATLSSLSGSVGFCQVTVSSPTTGFTITPQVSADGVTWSAATTINNGSITAPGTYVGAVNGTNFPNFRINVGAVGSGNLVGYTVCTQSLPQPAYSPFPQATGNFGNLVCSAPVLCSPSTGPTPAVAFTAAPTFAGPITANGGVASTPQHYTGTCIITTAQTCNATQTVVAGTFCVSGFTSNPAVDSTHTLVMLAAVSGTTLTTTVNVAQATNTTNTPTWVSLCL